MNKKAVFIITVDIIGLICFIASLFFDVTIKTIIMLCMLGMTFIAYQVVSIWLINRITDEEDDNEPTD